MTAAMPRTKPNIMMTARLLLMPVLKSVELKVVDCANADRVLRARIAAAMRSEGSRERIFGWMCLMIFIRVFILIFLSSQRLFRRTRDDNLTNAESEDVIATQNAMKSLLWVKDEQNTGLDEARQTPRIELAVAARNPRPVPRAAANHLRRAARGTRTHQTRSSARKLSAARTNGGWENRNGRRADDPDFWRGTIVPFRHVGVSKSGSAGPAAGRAAG